MHRRRPGRRRALRGSLKANEAALVLIPPPDAWPAIQAIRRQHDPHVARWMPHVTLLYPFRPRDEHDSAAAVAARTCGALPPFTVTLGRFAVFAESHTVWLAPEPPEPIVRLQAALQAAFPDCDDVARHPAGFVPHLSVARGDADLRDRLQARWRPLAFETSEVALIARESSPEAPFVVTRTVALGR